MQFHFLTRVSVCQLLYTTTYGKNANTKLTEEQLQTSNHLDQIDAVTHLKPGPSLQNCQAPSRLLSLLLLVYKIVRLQVDGRAESK